MQINPTTLVFEIINFLVLVWLLSKLLYRPLREAIVTREHALEQERAQSERALSEARALEQDWKAKHAELAQLADRVRAEALAGASAEQADMLSRAREEAAAERSKAETLLRAEREAAEQWVRSTAIDRSTELAGELLHTLAPDAVDLALTEGLIDMLERRGAELLGSDSQPSPALEVELVGAHVPREPVVERVRHALAAVLSESPRFNVREDPSLRAGLQLRVGDRLLDASLAGKLQAFRDVARSLAEGLQHD